MFPLFTLTYLVLYFVDDYDDDDDDDDDVSTAEFKQINTG